MPKALGVALLALALAACGARSSPEPVGTDPAEGVGGEASPEEGSEAAQSEGAAEDGTAAEGEAEDGTAAEEESSASGASGAAAESARSVNTQRPQHACRSDRDCRRSQVCVAPEEFAICGTDLRRDDCGPGFEEDNCGRCHPLCASFQDCPQGMDCNGHICIHARECVSRVTEPVP